MVGATTRRDYNLLQAIMVVYALIIVAVNILVDIITWIDPRCRGSYDRDHRSRTCSFENQYVSQRKRAWRTFSRQVCLGWSGTGRVAVLVAIFAPVIAP
ncbi:MAG: hypothetical protein R2845_06540 [Thermomicrobiales bacterium]